MSVLDDIAAWRMVLDFPQGTYRIGDSGHDKNVHTHFVKDRRHDPGDT